MLHSFCIILSVRKFNLILIILSITIVFLALKIYYEITVYVLFSLTPLFKISSGLHVSRSCKTIYGKVDELIKNWRVCANKGFGIDLHKTPSILRNNKSRCNRLQCKYRLMLFVLFSRERNIMAKHISSTNAVNIHITNK